MRRLPALALSLALLLAAACGDTTPSATPTATPTATATGAPTTPPTEPAGEPTAAPTTPAGEPTPTSTEPTTGAGTDEVVVYLVRSHETELWVEPVPVTLDEPTVAVARAAMEALVSGAASAGAHPALETMVPDGTRLLDASVGDDGVLTVDLSGEVRDGSQSGGAGEEVFAQQLAHTGAQFDTVDAVRLWVEGEPVDELWGHLDWSEPVEPDEFATAPIWFTSHTWGEQVPAGDVTIGGEACTFEATVELRLIAPDGSLAEEAFTTATSACPEGGSWEHTFTLGQPGTWTIEAVEPDPSGGEGRPPLVTTLELEAT